MKRLTLLISMILVFVSTALAQTTAFTYQGKLTDGGSPPTGQYDFVFKLYDQVDVILGTQIGSDVLSNDVQVTAGIFTVNLDFGAAAFTSCADRYLEISVRPGASTGAYTALAPRQPLTSSPFSIKTLSATSSDSLSAACVLCVTDGHIVSIDGSKVTGTVNNAATATNVSGVVQIANGGTGSTTQNFVDLATNQRRIGGDKEFLGVVSVAGTNGVFNGNGSGLTNLNGANLTAGSVNGTQIGDFAITSINLRNGSVLTDKISDGAVTAAKLAPDAIPIFFSGRINGPGWGSPYGTSNGNLPNTSEYLSPNRACAMRNLSVLLSYPPAISITVALYVNGNAFGCTVIAGGSNPRCVNTGTMPVPASSSISILNGDLQVVNSPNAAFSWELTCDGLNTISSNKR